MRTRNALLVFGAGIWFMAQVVGGNALGRLGLIGHAADERDAEQARANDEAAGVVPAPKAASA